ncbi:MAG: O-antigen ligase family protein [Clostridia bacterium]|nr:O-antigen ligase family protein [Clostridia bacterium]
MSLTREGKIYKLPLLPFAEKLSAFLGSAGFIVVVAAIVLVANIFALELIAYGFFTLVAVFVSVFGKDYLSYTPMLLGCYITPNFKNNPGRYGDSIFSFTNGGGAILIMAAVIVAALIYRLIADRELGSKMFKTKRKLLWGMLALGTAYVLSGVGVKGYTTVAVKNIRFGLIQFAAIFVPYFLLSGGVKWKDVDKRYCAHVGLVMGLTVGLELVGVYIMNGVFIDGVLHRENIFAGWGINNNMGVLISMAIPFAFYFVHKNDRPILYNVLAVMLCVFSLLTCSRTCILASAAVYVGCLIFILSKSPCKRVKKITIVNIFVLIATLGVMSVLTYKAFWSAFSAGLKSDARLRLYKLGLQIFWHDPIFGSSFYTLNDLAHGENASWIWSQMGGFNDIIPGRWHNTIVQIAAACGLVGLAAYLLHRVQTVLLIFKKPTAEKVFIGLSIMVLLVMSLLDCHFFNIGPTLFYSAALAFIESSSCGEEMALDKKLSKSSKLRGKNEK